MGYADPQKQKDYCKRHYRLNKARYLARNVRQRETIKAYIQSEKSKPCTDCNETYPYYVMDFDHRGGKVYEVNRMHVCGSLELVKQEIAKCDLVCSNCHRVRTHERAQNARETLQRHEAEPVLKQAA